MQRQFSPKRKSFRIKRDQCKLQNGYAFIFIPGQTKVVYSDGQTLQRFVWFVHDDALMFCGNSRAKITNMNCFCLKRQYYVDFGY